jgi:cobalamin synthase
MTTAEAMRQLADCAQEMAGDFRAAAAAIDQGDLGAVQTIMAAAAENSARLNIHFVGLAMNFLAAEMEATKLRGVNGDLRGDVARLQEKRAVDQEAIARLTKEVVDARIEEQRHG